MRHRMMLGVLGVSLIAGGRCARAGELNVAGNLNVSSNLTAQAITLGGQNRTNWSGAVADLGHTPTLAGEGAYSIVLTNHAVWDFGGHAAGRRFSLKIAQDAIGGRTNVWPADVRWPGKQQPWTTTQADGWDMFEFLDDGHYYNLLASGLGYGNPCVTNCNQFAYKFDTRNYAEVATSTDFYPTNGTAECWVKVATGSLQQEVRYALDFCQYPNNGWILGVTGNLGAGDGYPGFCMRGPSNEWWMVGTSRVNDGQWHHIAACWTSAIVELYVDGQRQAEHANNVGAFASPANPRIGCGEVLNWRGFRDVVDEARISRVKRYSANFTPATSFSLDAETVAYWRFNETQGSIAVDETEQHNGTLKGTPLPLQVEGR